MAAHSRNDAGSIKNRQVVLIMTPAQLKQARLDAGLTQEQMARNLKVGTSTIRKWESLEEFKPTMGANVKLRFEAWQREAAEALGELE